MKYRFDKILFYLSIVILVLMLAFTYGFFVNMNKIFPYKIIQNVTLAAKAVYEVYFVNDPDVLGVDFLDSDFSRPTINHFSPEEGKELILIVSNEFAHRDLNPSGCFAWLMNRNGKILHAWKNVPGIQELLVRGDKLKFAQHKVRIYPVGAYLYPNGDLLVTYQGKNIFPIPRGMVKFDKNSNIIWQNNEYLHHWIDVDIQGNIYAPGTRIVKSPLNIPNSHKSFYCADGKLTIETVNIIDPDGNTIKKIDLLKAFVESGLQGVFNNNGQDDASMIHTCDPIHLNDIRIVSRGQADKINLLKQGDLLLSFRSLNAVGILDKESQLFKWFHVGASDNQHSPRLLSDGRILIFDNLGGPKSKYISRIAYVRIPDGEWGTVFPKEGVALPPRPFHSKTAGHIDIHPDETRMLVSWTHQGLVWEIDIQSGKVLWEYINTHPLSEERNGRISVYTSLYVENVGFEMNNGVFNNN